MQLPASLRAAVETISQGVPLAELRKAAEVLSRSYRSEAAPPPIRSRAEEMAYLHVRMPATYAAAHSALSEVAAALPAWEPKSMLDLGSGPGTGVWAAKAVFPTIESLFAVERAPGLIETAKALCGELPIQPVWTRADLSSWHPDRRYDLVLASYSAGELTGPNRGRLLAMAWECCLGTLVVIEPGTRKGFGVIAEARKQLIALGAPLVAPCPHQHECPMQSAGDWCHFAARVERSAEHRRLKQGELGHEDEKFSYLAVSRVPAQPAAARIVRHPQRYSGFVKLELCSQEGLENRTVTRSQKEAYRAVKRVGWGSAWE